MGAYFENSNCFRRVSSPVDMTECRKKFIMTMSAFATSSDDITVVQKKSFLIE
jgi:hypothetical protein